MTVNGIYLNGVKRAGKWRFLCPSFPDLAIKHSGDEEPFDLVRRYLELALAHNPPAEVPPRRPA